MSSRLSPSAFRKQIESGKPERVYLFAGPDHETKAAMASLLAESLEDDLRAFNFDRLHVADSRPEARRQVWTLIDLAKTLPMMAPWRVIIVQGVEKLVAALRKAEGSRDEWAELGALQGRKKLARWPVERLIEYHDG